ncbi:MAG: LysR family transcriptional regulator [Bdellovibrionales bacterium]|nr:LysR family transcriptional regulator [Bdellovibrionales bacterium]
MINSQDLTYFMQIAKEGHLSKAAQTLGVTQPTLSHSLKKIENELGLELFIRSKKGVKLTAPGEKLYQHGHEFLLHWNQLFEQLHNEVNVVQGLIKLGCHTAVAKYTLPNFIPKLTKNYPKLKIQLFHDLSRNITAKVIADEIDIGIVVNPIEHNELVIKPLLIDQVTLWKPKNCLNEKLLMLDPDLIQSQYILNKMKGFKSKYGQTLESSSLEVIALLLESGAGHAILPEKVIMSLKSKNIVKVNEAPKFNDRICLIYKHEFRKLKRGEVFINTLVATI